MILQKIKVTGPYSIMLTWIGSTATNNTFSSHRIVLRVTMVDLVLIQKAVSYWEIRTKEAFSSPGFVIVVW